MNDAASAVAASAVTATPHVSIHDFWSAVSAIPFSSATWFVLFTLAFFIWLFAKASRDPKNPVAWEDMILATETGKASPYKMGYLVGVIVGTWIVITLSDAGKLTFDIFGEYLTFLLGGVGVAAAFKSKKDADDAPTPAATTPAPESEDDPAK